MKKTQKNMPSSTNGEQAQESSATVTETPLLYHPLSYLECKKDGVIEAAFDTEFGRHQLINEGAILSQSRRQVLSRQFIFEKSRNTPSNRNIFIDNAFAPAFNKACLDKGVPNSFSIYQGSDETGNIISEALKLEGFKVGESIKGLCDSTPYRRLKCELKIFFATADIALIGGYSPNNYLFAKLQSWMMATRGDRIDGGKRIKCRSEQSHDGFLNTGLLLTVDGFTYELAIGIKDIAAIGGQVRSLAGLLKAVGLDTATKGLIQAKDKARMDAYALEHPSEFMAYALADVCILSPLLFEWSNLWSQSYDKMGLTSYFTSPTMSFGKTQSNLILSYFAKALGIAPSKGDTLKDIKDVFGKYNQFGVNALCSNLNSTKVLLALVCGGRAFRKNARLHSLDKLILEYDLAGAYASAMRLLYYPFGCNPVIREYKVNESIKLASVGSVLKANGVQVIQREDGTHYFDWENSNIPRHGLQMIVNAKALTYPQDLIPSTNKIDLDTFAKRVRSADDIEDIIEAHDEAFDSEKGINKVHLFDIENGIITTHILDLIGEVCHKRQFNELMKKMKVRTFAFYPAEYEIKVDNGDYQAAYEKMQEMRITHLQKHRSIAYEKTRYDKGLGHKVTESINHNREPHYWIRIPLAGMIDEFVGQRKIAAIIAGKKKNPLSELFKLQSNGTYGDLVSRYFAFSNPLLANNITAVCRCLVWVAEKTLNSSGSITDGRDCLMNRVLFPGTNQRILMSRVATMHSDLIERGKSIAPIEATLRKGEYKLAPLGGGGEIICENEMKEIGGGELRRFTNLVQDGKIIASRGWKIGKDSGAIEADNNYQLLDEMVIVHMRQWFPHNHLLNYQAPEVKATASGWEYGEMTSLFKIENKDIYQEGGAWRGSTDYALFNDGERPNIKARSNELGRTHWELVQDGDVIRFGEECKCLPIVRMMEELKEDNGRLITIPRPVLKEGIVKCGEYKQSPESYQRRGLVVGDSIMKVTLPKIMPLNHHTFISFTQYSGWDKAVSKLEREYGWGIEAFFCENNTHVRYREMNDAIIKAIREGVDDPIAYFSKKGLIAKKYPYQELIEAAKEQLEGYREADATPTMADEWAGVESSQMIGKWKKISFKPSRLVDKKDDCKAVAVEPEPMTIEIEGVQYTRKRFSSLRPPKG